MLKAAIGPSAVRVICRYARSREHGRPTRAQYGDGVGEGGSGDRTRTASSRDAQDRCWCICTTTHGQQKLQMHLIRFPRAQQAQDAKPRDPRRRRPLARLRRGVRDGGRHALGRSARLHAPQGEGMETTADSRDRGVLRSLTGRQYDASCDFRLYDPATGMSSTSGRLREGKPMP